MRTTTGAAVPIAAPSTRWRAWLAAMLIAVAVAALSFLTVVRGLGQDGADGVRGGGEPPSSRPAIVRLVRPNEHAAPAGRDADVRIHPHGERAQPKTG